LFFHGLLELRKDCFPDGRIFLGRQGVAADHLTPLTHPDFFDLQIDLSLLIPSLPGQNRLVDFLLPAYPAAQHRSERYRLGFGQQLDGVFGDHAPIATMVTWLMWT
jgi:hypothetical protein